MSVLSKSLPLNHVVIAEREGPEKGKTKVRGQNSNLNIPCCPPLALNIFFRELEVSRPTGSRPRVRGGNVVAYEREDRGGGAEAVAAMDRYRLGELGKGKRHNFADGVDVADDADALLNGPRRFQTRVPRKVFVEIIGCDKLPNLDASILGEKTDAFVSVVYEDCCARTDTVDNSLSPRWMPWTQRAFVFNMMHTR